jgi:hypothetical protein
LGTRGLILITGIADFYDDCIDYRKRLFLTCSGRRGTCPAHEHPLGEETRGCVAPRQVARVVPPDLDAPRATRECGALVARVESGGAGPGGIALPLGEGLVGFGLGAPGGHPQGVEVPHAIREFCQCHRAETSSALKKGEILLPLCKRVLVTGCPFARA